MVAERRAILEANHGDMIVAENVIVTAFNIGKKRIVKGSNNHRRQLVNATKDVRIIIQKGARPYSE